MWVAALPTIRLEFPGTVGRPGRAPRSAEGDRRRCRHAKVCVAVRASATRSMLGDGAPGVLAVGLLVDLELPPTATDLETGLAAIRSLAWFKCYDGWMPRGVAPRADADWARIRTLRHHPAILRRFGPRREDPFWEADDKRIALRSAILLNSSWLRPVARPARIPDLAHTAGLSTRAAYLMIDSAIGRGDLVREPDGGDARLRVIEPTDQLVRRAATLTVMWFAMMSEYTGRADPLALQDPAVTARAQRIGLEVFLNHGADPADLRKSFLPRALYFTVLDLLVDGPQDASKIVAEEARRLGVTPVTIRNAISCARRMQWLEPGPALVPTALACKCYSGAFTVLELRWNAALDVAERGWCGQAPRSGAQGGVTSTAVRSPADRAHESQQLLDDAGQEQRCEQPLLRGTTTRRVAGSGRTRRSGRPAAVRRTSSLTRISS